MDTEHPVRKRPGLCSRSVILVAGRKADEVHTQELRFKMKFSCLSARKCSPHQHEVTETDNGEQTAYPDVGAGASGSVRSRGVAGREQVCTSEELCSLRIK